jgi:hypothetical protein
MSGNLPEEESILNVTIKSIIQKTMNLAIE